MFIAAIHKNAALVAELGCIACYMMGYEGTPAEIHHLRCDVGGAQKSVRIIPLCPTHHRPINTVDYSLHGDPYDFKAKFGTEDELHKLTEQLLNE